MWFHAEELASYLKQANNGFNQSKVKCFDDVLRVREALVSKTRILKKTAQGHPTCLLKHPGCEHRSRMS
jgi:hypothetical protein